MERRSHDRQFVVDVMRVPATGDASIAVIAVETAREIEDIECEILVVGGGTGGVAALDEHEHIEAFGVTASYYRLRNSIRDCYRALAGAAGGEPAFNPGTCWVTRLAFEPSVALAAIEDML